MMQILYRFTRPALAQPTFFKAAGHELLPVEIVWRVTGSTETLPGKVEHCCDLIGTRDGDLLKSDARALFQRQGMDGYVFRTQSEHLFNSIPKPSALSPGEPGDEIHVHIKAAYLAQQVGAHAQYPTRCGGGR